MRDVDCKVAAPIVIVTGFVAATEDGAPTTLKRSGSDYSATIFAKLMDASGEPCAWLGLGSWMPAVSSNPLVRVRVMDASGEQ